ncbi:hypothetical protein V6N12_049296 [Hibiscus sabdariffa]|uniref:Uncharacterized protein n=1 Tax=Hibiscus sabdariffa TaxID=183260 RepID=A0ABR2AL44_9ROSI
MESTLDDDMAQLFQDTNDDARELEYSDISSKESEEPTLLDKLCRVQCQANSEAELAHVVGKRERGLSSKLISRLCAMLHAKRRVGRVQLDKDKGI